MKDRSSQSSTNPKPKLGQRIGQRIRSAGDLGREVVSDPSKIPGKAHGWLRRWTGKVWRVRGGGLYACGYIITFLWFEIQTIAGEVAESSGVGDFITSQVTEFITRFAMDTLANMIKAFIWPVYVVALYPPYGAIALGLAFVGFSRLLKEPIERWLFADEPSRSGIEGDE